MYEDQLTLMLIDAGAEYAYYTADITRTFPVSGTFTPAQRDVYQVVLDTQKAGVDATRVGGSLKAVHELTVRALAQGLLDLGALEGSVDQIVEEETYKTFYMHGTGHWLGMDVHDVGLYYTERNPTPFETGMVTTVEPGLYFSPNNPDTPAAFSGIGIRIEDDILVTEKGPVNLTAQVPTEIDAVEILCQEVSALSAELPTLPE